MSLPRHLLVFLLMTLPVIGCDAEDDDNNRPAEPAPAEPARPIPQPQVSVVGQNEHAVAQPTRPGDGPAFARPVT